MATPAHVTTRSAAAQRRAAAARKKKLAAARKKAEQSCTVVTKKVHVKGKTVKRKVKVCTPKKAKKVAGVIVQTAPRLPITAPATPPAPTAAPPAPGDGPVSIDPGAANRTLSAPQVQRLLWRAGFGPLPGQATQLAGQPLPTLVAGLTRPTGAATLVGPAAHDENGAALQPADVWGHDHLWWLDRMVRSDQPLVERMTLIWHDWFATSNDGVGNTQQMLDQNALLRAHALDGTFDDLFAAVTIDPAMLIWLNGTSNTKWNPNENYAREMMELFSLGADRGAYTETDVREMARVLTGWRNDWVSGPGNVNFRYDPTWHDATSKTVFGQTGNFDYRDATRLCVSHPLHASFFVTKLWSYFIPTAPDAATLAALQGVYLNNGRRIRPVVEAILQHPALHDGDDMVVPPIVYNAGLLRSIGRGIDTSSWAWIATYHGQVLFHPPNVSGWDDTRWLDTSTVRGRWLTALYLLDASAIDPWPPAGTAAYDPAETPAAAMAAALAYVGNPTMSADTLARISAFAQSVIPTTAHPWEQSSLRAERQNALRMLLVTAPDRNVC